jgi:putative two-component system response regulator
MMQQAPLVMVVDDNVPFLEVVEVVLQARGYRVVCCTGPDEALARIHAERPCLVVADVMMAGLDSGFSLSRRIKGDPQLAATPVILVTAMTSRRGFDFTPRSPEELAAMNADAYLAKPVAPEALLGKIDELLARTGTSLPEPGASALHQDGDSD